jgi:hypothetical protein
MPAQKSDKEEKLEPYKWPKTKGWKNAAEAHGNREPYHAQLLKN